MSEKIEHIGDIEIRAFQEPPLGYGVQIYIAGKNFTNECRVYVPSLKFVEIPEVGEYVNPTFSISPFRSNTLQVLIDDLWNIGVRPTEGTGSAGAMTATQEHLKDMQKIAFDLLKRVQE